MECLKSAWVYWGLSKFYSSKLMIARVSVSRIQFWRPSWKFLCPKNLHNLHQIGYFVKRCALEIIWSNQSWVDMTSSMTSTFIFFKSYLNICTLHSDLCISKQIQKLAFKREYYIYMWALEKRQDKFHGQSINSSIFYIIKCIEWLN